MSNERQVVSWPQTTQLVSRIAREIRAKAVHYDLLLAINDGLLPARILSKMLGYEATFIAIVGSDRANSRLRSIDGQLPPLRMVSQKRILMVKDVWQKGRLIVNARQGLYLREAHIVHTAVLHFKPTRNIHDHGPTYFAEATDQRITYPWDVSLQHHAQPA